MVKHTQTIVGKLPTNCLSIFDHFVGLALKGLVVFIWIKQCQFISMPGLYISNLLSNHKFLNCLKDALSGLRQFLATESPLKMMKNVFYFTSKALFVLKMFNFLSWLFWSCSKMAWLEGQCWFQNLWRHGLVNK